MAKRVNGKVMTDSDAASLLLKDPTTIVEELSVPSSPVQSTPSSTVIPPSVVENVDTGRKDSATSGPLSQSLPASEQPVKDSQPASSKTPQELRIEEADTFNKELIAERDKVASELYGEVVNPVPRQKADVRRILKDSGLDTQQQIRVYDQILSVVFSE